MYEPELAFANQLADRAAEIAMSFFGGAFEVRIKPDATPVTEADLAVEAMVRERIAAQFPDDAFLGEEHGRDGAGPRTWVVDPIDGTKNFAAGIQIWGTLIALMVEERPVVGVVGLPAMGERYEAATGLGARLNGSPIHVSDVARVQDAFVLFGTLSWDDRRSEASFLSLAHEAARTRAFGDCWAHMLVARGAAEAMIEEDLRTWDWAAPLVVIEEAGGRVTQLDGSLPADRSSVLSTNQRLHAQIVELLRSQPSPGGSGDEAPG